MYGRRTNALDPDKKGINILKLKRSRAYYTFNFLYHHQIDIS